MTTDFPVQHSKELIQNDIINAHVEYGKEIVRMYHGSEFIEKAVNRYKDIAKGIIPQNVENVIITHNHFINGEIGICDLIRLSGLSKSNSEAKRLIQGKGIKVNGVIVTDENSIVSCVSNLIVSRGKNKFVKIIIE